MAAKSMTGYGAAVRESERGIARAELKSVNHRFLEVSLNLPQRFLSGEAELRSLVAGRIKRARVDCWLGWEARGTSGLSVRIDRELMSELYGRLEESRVELAIPGEVSIDVLARFPELVRIEPVTGGLVRGALDDLLAALSAALDAHDQVRVKEGEALVRDLSERVLHLSRRTDEVAQLAELEPRRIAERLHERLLSLVTDTKLDSERIHQEAALLADRADVTEELVRLKAHLERARTLLAGDDELGKNMDFLLQEIGREVNTLGSKARLPEVSGHVLAMKSEVEKIREQARNLE